jgi:hypothetical protein
MKLRSLWALLALLLVGILVVPMTSLAAPKKGTNPLKDIHVHGAGDGATFEGKFTITSFQADDTAGILYAVGTMKGDVTRSDGTKAGVKNVSVRWPVKSINGTSLSSSAVTTGMVSAMQTGCEILDLQLGPLDLTLLGLHIFLDEVNLEITAIPGGGLLGDLLCAVNNLLNPLGALSQIANLLNQILAILNSL